MHPVVQELKVDEKIKLDTFVGHTFIANEVGTHRFIHRFFVEHGNVTTAICERSRDFEIRCERQAYEKPALIPGSISERFAAIPSLFPQYKPEVNQISNVQHSLANNATGFF